ncbi:PP2C family serine/threonine-protein phosphatase [Oceaniovalibus sp. ACAM 378]|uniref:PP2C family protein-serine/threonine phosphatase n=1 Tax=Oceaniovalibus sp. ACAM 378 TaxID=2599923 RepID=UPI0011D972C3|nr:protein phosphatase 2C domain-containing protein [Oceaniovalibus sp. ACAM 378]TYB84400.1 serine/threonine-protein phosphatase [Oceaniovalibus sp. ACAM 378]
MTHHIRHSAVTHVGRVRQVNEDSLLALPDQKIFLVADGMGGHAAGDFASQTVVETVAALPPDLPPNERMQALRGALEAAHQAIVAESARRGGATVGAAVVSLILANGHFAAFWAGDSRLYRLRDRAIELLTSDHSIVAEFVKAGKMTWDEAENHPQSNAITRAIGVGDEPGLEKIRGEVFPGDRFLLCSDGLNKYASFEMLRRAMQGAPIETVADKLLQLALDGGGQDNITIIVVDVI